MHGTTSSSPTSVVYWTGFGVLAVYFLCRAAFFAWHVGWGIPPDEHTHAGLIFHIAHAKTFWGLENLPAHTANIGTSFFLYHWALGSLLSWAHSLIGFDDRGAWLFVRSLNIVLALGSLLTLRSLAELILGRTWWTLLVVLLFSNVLMFTFLSAAVNYDNLAILLGLLSLRALLLFSRAPSVSTGAWLILWLTLGTLVKVSALPLAAIIGCTALWRVYRSRPLFPLSSGSVRKAWAPLALSSIAVLAAVSLWGSNYHSYGTVFPSCADRLSHERCMEKDPVYRKYFALGEENSARVALIEEHLLDPVRFFPLWFDMMVEKSVGIFAYRSFYHRPAVLGVIQLLFLVLLSLAITRLWIHKDQSLQGRDAALLFSVSATFLLFIAYYVNYRYYLASGLLVRYEFVGIQGRYSFPVLGALLIACIYGLKNVPLKALRSGLVAMLVTVCLYSDLPAFLTADPRTRFLPNADIQARHLQATVIQEALTER